MHLFGILIFRWPLRNGDPEAQPILAAADFKLSSFSFFKRGYVKDWGVFFAKTLLKNVSPGVRETVTEEEYSCHAQVRHDGISGCVITDREYPARVAFGFLQQLLDEFCSKYKGQWEEMLVPGAKLRDFPRLEEYLLKYQNPLASQSSDPDKMTAIMKDIDETKIIMYQNIEQALSNGQSIDALVDKSEDLSREAKRFYKQAKEANRCCIIL